MLKIVATTVLATAMAASKGGSVGGCVPQTTTDTNCAGVYGSGDDGWLGCVPEVENNVFAGNYEVTDIVLQEVHGQCIYKHSKDHQDASVDTVLLLSIRPTNASNAVSRQHIGVFLSGNEVADSNSPHDCQHYNLKPITTDSSLTDPTSGCGLYITDQPNKCGNIDSTEPDVELLVHATLLCSKPKQTLFEVSVCVSYDDPSIQHSCFGLDGAHPYSDGFGNWSPCSCTTLEIDITHTFPPLGPKGGKGYDTKKGYDIKY
jgi:hypothetical protein